MRNHKALLAALTATTLAFAPACRNTAEGVKEDTRQNMEKARVVEEESKQAAQEIGGRASEVAGELAHGARELGDAIQEGAKDVGSEVGAKKQTVDVKAALMLEETIDASRIDVDTDADTRTVTLNGSVPTAAQRAAAERLAREKAEGYAVRNLLTVEKR